MKVFAYYVLGLMTRLVFFLSRLVPERAFVHCSRKGAALYMASSRRYRRRIAKNLKIAFGSSYQTEQVKAFTRKLGNHVGISVAEMFFSATPRRQDLLNRIRIHGKEHLKKALALGKGVIAVSAHIGNFTLISMKMVAEGYPFIMLVKESKYKAVAKVLRMLQDKQGGRFIYIKPWNEALRKILACLRRNEIVCMVTDEKKKHSGVEVDFFGQPAATALGPAVISVRTGSPVVPVFIVRNGDGTHTIYIEPPLDRHVTNDRKEDERILTAAYTKVIERYVRAYPEQWSWINNRWRRYDGGSAAGSKRE
jgi:KDO2-lipid IV(A) lauroyltransferase